MNSMLCTMENAIFISLTIYNMTGNTTFTMIKPDAVAAGHIGDILSLINASGYRICAMKLTRLSREQAANFYAVHRERPFYGGLIDFMTSGPVVAAVLEKENAVEEYRKLIGNTDPSKAEEGTVRKLFAQSIQKNAVHGSDSDENAVREANFFFPAIEKFGIDGSLLE
jgi:nucleoside-diphosphate kinase